MTDKNSTQAGVKMGGKISAKELGFKKSVIQEMVFKDKENPHFLYRLTGIATGLKPYKNRFEDKAEEQEGFGVLGMFRATKPDGEMVTGSTLYLPAVAQDMLVAAMMGGGNNAEIAVDVYAKFDEDAATSYVFEVRALVEDHTALDALEMKIREVPLPALPAPAKK